ncbi:hypothetical protein Bbelb_319180 [Branchiostoma belcheri]|nr:hypothetical protein Bbelb_319180 [Branchiostoma belcheri]
MVEAKIQGNVCPFLHDALQLTGLRQPKEVGNGKSHTGNTILGQEVFRVTRRGGTEKSSLCSSSHEVDGVSRKVTVVDTPGVSQGMTESEFEELVQAVKMVPEGFDAICLVWDYNNSDRNEEKEVQVFQSLHRLFGDGLYKHLVILVTHAHQEDIPEFLDELPEAMKEITKHCHNRVMAVENKNKTINHEALRTLIDCSSKVSYGRRYATSDLSSLCQIPEGDELSIVLVGKTGVGKSHTGNNITQQGEFVVSELAASETRLCQQHIRQKDRKIAVLDTPGVFDTGNVEGICEELCPLVRPHLEYSATVWDPYTTKGIQAVEAVQRRAARVTLNDYQRTSSVTQMLNDLQWPLLSERRRKARLTTFYKLTHNIIKIPTSNLLKPAQGRTRGSHQYKYQPIHARTDAYKYSFFPRTVPQWNALPGPVVMAPTVEYFRARLEACPP